MVHSPHIRQQGAGAKGVEFWIEGETCSIGVFTAEVSDSAKIEVKGKGKAQAKSLASPGPRKYINVFNFFKAGLQLFLTIL